VRFNRCSRATSYSMDFILLTILCYVLVCEAFNFCALVHWSNRMNFYWCIHVYAVDEGSALDGCTYSCPTWDERTLPLLAANHVTATKGTGLVHTAPAHGAADFQVALKHQLSMVNDPLPLEFIFLSFFWCGHVFDQFQLFW